LTSATAEGEWSASRTGRFNPETEPQYPSRRRLAGPQSQSGQFGETIMIMMMMIIIIIIISAGRQLYARKNTLLITPGIIILVKTTIYQLR
jgi:hypothetical protein